MPIGQDQQTVRRELDQLDSDTLRWALDLAKLARDPMLPGLIFAVVLIVISLGTLIWSGVSMARFDYVSLQLPYVVSGGLGAIGLVIVGVSLGSVLGNRRDQAFADEELARIGDEISDLKRQVLQRRADAKRDG